MRGQTGFPMPMPPFMPPMPPIFDNNSNENEGFLEEEVMIIDFFDEDGNEHVIEMVG